MRYPTITSVDQVMAAIVLADNADLTPEEFGQFLADQPDLSPKAWPRYVWLTDRLPTTATNKILKRELTARGATPEQRRALDAHRAKQGLP